MATRTKTNALRRLFRALYEAFQTKEFDTLLEYVSPEYLQELKEALGDDLDERDVSQMSCQTMQITELLARRHPPPEWAHWEELRLGTGYGRGREQRWDFAALNLWPSKGHSLVVYEIKVTRADFLRELSNPGKRAAAEKAASECWFAMPCGLAKVDEIPEGWGLIQLTKGGLKKKKAAQQKQRPPLDENLILSIARRDSDEPTPLPEFYWKIAGRNVSQEELEKIVEKIHQRQLEGVELRVKSDLQREHRNEIRRLQMLESDIRSLCGATYKERETSTSVLLQRWVDETKDRRPINPRLKESLTKSAQALLSYFENL